MILRKKNHSYHHQLYSDEDRPKASQLFLDILNIHIAVCNWNVPWNPQMKYILEVEILVAIHYMSMTQRQR